MRRTTKWWRTLRSLSSVSRSSTRLLAYVIAETSIEAADSAGIDANGGITGGAMVGFQGWAIMQDVGGLEAKVSAVGFGWGRTGAFPLEPGFAVASGAGADFARTALRASR